MAIHYSLVAILTIARRDLEVIVQNVRLCVA